MSFMRRSYTYGGCLIENNKYMIDSDWWSNNIYP